MAYLRDHWRGNHGLLRSFWINLVTLRIAILFAERLTHPPLTEQSPLAFAMAVAFAVVFHGIVFAWQAVGVVRAGDAYQRGLGAPVTVMGLHAGLIVMIIATLFSTYTAIQAHVDDPSHQRARQIRPGSLDNVTLTISADGTRLALAGDFGIGITGKLGELLAAHPSVTTLVLDSDGGSVFEGRGVARLIAERGLDTTVLGRCLSACTTAYVAGRRRMLGPEGRLGFHQFGFADPHAFPAVDPAEEQEKDRAFFAGRGIDPEFLEKIFQAPQSGIWIPEASALLAAGVVHAVMENPGSEEIPQ